MNSGSQVQHETDERTMDAQKRGLRGLLLKIRAVEAIRFFGEVKREVRRIDWPGSQELRSSTKVVVGAMLLAGFVTYGVDLILQGAIHSLNALSLWFAG